MSFQAVQNVQLKKPLCFWSPNFRFIYSDSDSSSSFASISFMSLQNSLAAKNLNDVAIGSTSCQLVASIACLTTVSSVSSSIATGLAGTADRSMSGVVGVGSR